MPKRIKKKAAAKHGDEIKGTLHEIGSFYEKQKKEIHIAVVITAILVIAALAYTGYMKYTSSEAEKLKMTGYANYYAATGADRPVRLKASFEAFQRSNSLKPSPVTLLYMAACTEELGKPDDAVKLLLDLNSRYTQNNEILPLSYFKLFNIYKEKKEFDKALEALKSLYALPSQSYKDAALYEWAVLLTQLGKGQEAQDKYAQLTKDYPGSAYIIKDTADDNNTLSDATSDNKTPALTDNTTKKTKPQQKK
ncbi:MAG: tetratricopeptide repeat protein [Nitrospirae bacterium]|nr:tetratricopeptide repeat protein [Nitrospirota bacterium]MBF0534895.1 tetratricopeptide repeat protein [Nitrospirota bacterium]MBF0616810.1 tetratricopeptide repeat protein [Nitrospirota bacterium]